MDTAYLLTQMRYLDLLTKMIVYFPSHICLGYGLEKQFPDIKSMQELEHLRRGVLETYYFVTFSTSKKHKRLNFADIGFENHITFGKT